MFSRNSIIVTIISAILALFFNIDGSFLVKDERKDDALNYFCQKYDIKQREIKVEVNDLHADERFWSGEDKLEISYKGNKYTIVYHKYSDKEYFSDNYQHNLIYNDLQTYLNNKFPFATSIVIEDYLLKVDIDNTPEKYNGDIVDYMRNIRKLETKTNNNGESYVTGSAFCAIWFDTTGVNDIKSLHDKYIKQMIKDLEEIKMNYRITFSDNQLKVFNSSYFYDVNGYYAAIESDITGEKYRIDRNKLLSFLGIN